jgi:uncharacterized protein
MHENVGFLLSLASVLLATGFAAGILAGLLGVGGGIVIVPVLFHLFSIINIDPAVKMHLAVGTSLATIIPTSIVSARAHYRRDAVDMSLLRTWAVWVFLGVLAGTVIAGLVRGPVLTGIFAAVALAVAANMAFRPEGSRLRDDLPSTAAQASLAVVIGGLSAMMGIGGGTLSVPTLSAFNYPIRKAVGTASAIGLIIAVPGAIGFIIAGLDAVGRPPFSLGYVNLLGFALIVPATILAAPLGARLAHTIEPTLLRRAFALFLFLTALRMLWGLFG